MIKLPKTVSYETPRTTIVVVQSTQVLCTSFTEYRSSSDPDDGKYDADSD